MKDIGRLQVLTDLDADADPLQVVDAALVAGAPVIQVRAKGVTDRELFELADAVVARCRVVGATCLVDDRVDIAQATGADGVHLGDEDLPVDVARTMRRLHAPEALGLDPDDRSSRTSTAHRSTGADRRTRR